MRQRMVQITNEAALSVLGLKNDLARLERSYNESRMQCLRWEKILAITKDAINNSYMEKERTIDAITNLHRILCRRRGEILKCQDKRIAYIWSEFIITIFFADIPFFAARGDFGKLLDSIKNEVEILTGVMKEMESSDSAVKQGEVRDQTLC